ncbi:hypothetical protein FOXG_20385 [Fusarium oxysporum f. sp. lycopersici 4287]|uniref:Uncharacterized protein n=1 Tax=Fusarium oxysporum f. sp. lycopersici (strain 4287 / CBS 123668 / FGSC 9935 / NRRL 34936) TaxID=426428 RepID=A0A0J9VHV3_FUSO4|nr:hypothetical protein FOXG_20385 [Fusarium oxysporum f. sp. lycopersici 4287]KAJ9429849.1 hypothetical protein QL093DRAFT_2093040 [Fusarium oxysporum]KNB10693.1 hypothetical protein FOXG_20385 [Fusarium oxysporum f. sp. lycopersici 4287]
MAGGGGPSSGTVESPLSQAYGYGIVILNRYNNEQQNSELFNTAGSTVKSGLVVSAVASSWA